MKKKILILFLVLFSVPILAQRDLEKMLSNYKNPEELVTLSEEIPFEQAIEVLSKVSEKTTGQKIVSTAGFNEPIGIKIENMQYKEAFKIIVQYNNLIYEEKPEVIIVRKKDELDIQRDAKTYASVDTREVQISAIFFEANLTEMRSRGINWQFMLSRSGLKIGSEFKSFIEDQTAATGGTAGGASQQQQSPPDFQTNFQSEYTMGEFEGTSEGIFKFFEEENLGEIIARPSITVRDGNVGKIQIGQDISIKQRDFAGNVIDVFVPTGTILDITPYIYEEDGVDYILLKIKAERSTAPVVTELSTTINKTNATTEVLMLDGEKTAIGGLFVNAETSVRRGIPFLKDLPWWFFGLRYIFGYDEVEITKNETIIILEAKILPTLKERMAERKEGKDVLKQYKEEGLKSIEQYKTKKEDEENED
jgi:type IV pilus assembly protein PilQ